MCNNLFINNYQVLYIVEIREKYYIYSDLHQALNWAVIYLVAISTPKNCLYNVQTDLGFH